MKIIEMFMMSKTGNQERCEDSIVINEHFACVIDGVTSKSDEYGVDNTSGLQAVAVIGNMIHELRKDVTCEEAIESLTNSLYLYYKHNHLLKEIILRPYNRLSASLVIYSKNHNEIWMVGECQCMIDDILFINNKIVDDILANARALYLELEIIYGKDIFELIKHDTGRDYIRPLLEQQALLENIDCESPYSYGVINGFHVPSKFIKNIQVPESARHVVLASDGYPILKPKLQDSEDALRKIIMEDPLCIKLHKSTKGVENGNVSYDDRAYLRFEI